MNVNKLKGLMAENNETYKDLAKLLNVSVMTIYNKMKGKRVFTVDELALIAKHYKVDVNYFFNFKVRTNSN
jgi:transcriptional regulator with XRE-family HTH domain